jgi:putative zinc finger/helix-turn-helix YgiT family protein
MKCIDCKSNELENRLAHVPIEIKGESFSVEMKALVCPGCGYTTIDGGAMAEYMRLGADAFRAKHGRLTSSEIRTRRRHWLNMSQAEFAKYLPVGPVSVKRWELGQVQDGAMDQLIRLKTDPAQALENYFNVCKLTGVALAGIIDAPMETEWRPNRKQYDIAVKDWEEELAA